MVKRLAHDAYQGEPLDGPIKIHLIHCFEIPKSYSKKRKKACLEGIERPTKKPDIDNVYKGVADAMSGIIYCDDKQVDTIACFIHITINGLESQMCGNKL